MEQISKLKYNEDLERRPLLEHVRALKHLLFFCIGVIAVLFLLLFSFYANQLMLFISRPITDIGIEIIYTNISDAFMAKLKLSWIAACVAASPAVIIAIWMFIRPALYQNERIVFGLMTIASCGLFLLGVLFAYNVVFRLAVNYFLISGEDLATPLLSISQYVSFLFSFLIPFGIAFLTPVIVVILTRIGLVEPKMLKNLRRYIILLVFIVAAILTPPDVVSQILLALPLLVLFEIGILLSGFVKARTDAEGKLEEEKP